MPRKEYYQAHREEILKNKREYYAENREKINEYNRQWQRKHRDVTSRLNREYQHRIKAEDPCHYYTENTWRTLNQRCVSGCYSNSPSVLASKQMQAYHKKNIRLEMTKDELRTFWYANEEKVKDIILSGGIPSIDRIDDDKHYSLDNVQILDRKENLHKSKGHSANPQKIDKRKARENNQEAYRRAKQEYNKGER